MQSLLKHNDEQKIGVDKIYGITLVSDNKRFKSYWNPVLLKNQS